MVKIVKDTDIKPSKTIKPIKKLFSHLLEKLSEDEDQNKSKIRLAKRIEDDLIEKIKM